MDRPRARLAAFLRALGCEKLPGLVEHAKPGEDLERALRQTEAWATGEEAGHRQGVTALCAEVRADPD